MEPTRRQLHKPQERPQRHKLAGPIHRSQDRELDGSIRQTFVCQRESRASQQGERQSKECRELLHASPEREDFLLEFWRAQVRYLQAHDDLRCHDKPPTGRRGRDAEIRRDGHVPGAFDETSKPVIVALLTTSHADDHRPFAHAVQLLEATPFCYRLEMVRQDDNSRWKMQNVGGDSSPPCPKSIQCPAPDGAANLTMPAGDRRVYFDYSNF
jgi:hypothetical protein